MSSDKASARPGKGIQVIARAAHILRALENEKEGLSLGQIAKKVELPRSTVQRIVNALAEEHLLIGASLNARVKLGPSILRMASNSDFDFTAEVRPHLEALSQITGETVDLSVHESGKMVFVDQIAANHRLSAVSAIGESFSMHSSANGKAALSIMSDDQVVELLGGRLPQETPNTITELDALLSALADIRKNNIASDNEENAEGICALGTAFRDPLGRIYAVSVPVPVVRFTKMSETIAEAIQSFRQALMDATLI